MVFFSSLINGMKKPTFIDSISFQTPAFGWGVCDEDMIIEVKS